MQNSCLVKICGIKDIATATDCVEAGADALGINLIPTSIRYLERELALTLAKQIKDLFPNVSVVFVVADFPLESLQALQQKHEVDYIQLHGSEDPAYVGSLHAKKIIKAFRLGSVADIDDIDRFSGLYQYALFDHKDVSLPGTNVLGGTGKQMSANLIDELQRRGLLKNSFLAGGLTPENISQVVEKYSPYYVDVASGVESPKGVKNKLLISKFITSAKRTCRETLP